MNLIDEAKNYANGLPTLLDWTVTGVVVDKDKAQSRADVCTGRLTGNPCPLNKPGRAITREIAAAINRFVEFKNHLNLRCQGEKQLLSCHACNCELRTKVWQELETILPDDSERKKLDPQCWILKEMQS